MNTNPTPRRPRSGTLTTIFSTVCVFLGVCLLMGLSAWQFSRYFQKTEQIAAFEQNITQQPVPIAELIATAARHSTQSQPPTQQLNESSAESAAESSPESSAAHTAQVQDLLEFRNVELEGQLFAEIEVYLVGYSQTGSPGFKVFNPMLLRSGALVLIERGWVAPHVFEPEKRPETLPSPDDSIAVSGIVRYPYQANIFVPENEPQNRLWFSVDLRQMRMTMQTLDQNQRIPAQAPLLPFYVLAGENPYGLYPLGKQWRIQIHNPHLNYAFTWLALAAALTAMFVFTTVKRRRKRRQAPPTPADA